MESKYQNVASPRFYVDHYQYAFTAGLLNENDINIESGNNITTKKIKSLFYLNPASLKKLGTDEKLFSINEYNSYKIESNTTNYIAFLGHKNLRFQLSWFADAAAGLLFGEETRGSVNTDLAYNGFTIIDYDLDGGDFLGNGYGSTLSLQFLETEEEQIVNCVSIGTSYEVPYSPDLELTMTRQFGIANKKYSINGSLLTNLNYTQPPTWGDGEAWGLYTDTPTNIKARRAGRRVWNLKFSYISDSDIMSNIEMLTDSGLPDDHDYETFEIDSSFFPQFMQKTLGGSLKFIFQPNKDDYNPDGFAICVLDQNSISIKQVAHNTYSISLKIMEVW